MYKDMFGLHNSKFFKLSDSLLGGRYSIIWVIQVGAAGQGMFFGPRCPKQGIQFDLPLS